MENYNASISNIKRTALSPIDEIKGPQEIGMIFRRKSPTDCLYRSRYVCDTDSDNDVNEDDQIISGNEVANELEGEKEELPDFDASVSDDSQDKEDDEMEYFDLNDSYDSSDSFIAPSDESLGFYDTEEEEKYDLKTKKGKEKKVKTPGTGGRLRRRREIIINSNRDEDGALSDSDIDFDDETIGTSVQRTPRRQRILRDTVFGELPQSPSTSTSPSPARSPSNLSPVQGSGSPVLCQLVSPSVSPEAETQTRTTPIELGDGHIRDDMIDLTLDDDNDDNDEGSIQLLKPKQRPKSSSKRTCVEQDRDKRLTKYKKFKNMREQLAKDLYKEFNALVFNNDLPRDMSIAWNARLLTTAGVTHMKGDDKNRCTTIELSLKVIDCVERLRLTLAHEMCHAAAWFIDGERRPPHGAAFWRWARRCQAKIVNMEVTTCHSYTIHKPHRFQCEAPDCAQTYNRFSKSIKVNQQVCGICHNKLIYRGKFHVDGTPQKRRVPSGFSLYVKKNFAEVRSNMASENGSIDHGSVMRELSRRFKEKGIEQGDGEKGVEAQAEAEAEAAVGKGVGVVDLTQLMNNMGI